MESDAHSEPVAVCLGRDYDVARLREDLSNVRAFPAAPQPGPYHRGEWTGIALHSMGGKQSTFPSAAGQDCYRGTDALERTPYFRQILDELRCPKEVVRILFLPPGGHIKDHFDFHTSFQFGLLRLHLPIVTHPEVEFVIGGARMTWEAGELWYGDFSKVHSVKNNSDVTRVHMVIDVQVNEFVLRLFPPEFVARRRAEGISVSRTPIPSCERQLRQFTCDFHLPGAFLPMFVIGKPLASLTKGARVSVRLIDGTLWALIDQAPAFSLTRIDEDAFTISGLPSGMTLRLRLERHAVREVILQMRGLPQDLYAARLGVMRGPLISEQSVSLPVIDTSVADAVGSFN